MRASRAVELILRLVVGGLFIYASIDKIIHVDEFADILGEYQMLRDGYVNPLAMVLNCLPHDLARDVGLSQPNAVSNDYSVVRIKDALRPPHSVILEGRQANLRFGPFFLFELVTV